MNVNLKIPLDFTDNIIAQAEFRHQRYVINTSRSPRGWIIMAVLLLAPAAITSLVLLVMGYLGASIEPFLAPPNTLLGRLTQIGMIALVTMNIALYLVVILITLGLSSNSITREHESKNWDVLLLTNVNARQIVRGKWWASLQALWGDHLMVGIVRLGLVGGLVAFHQDRLPAGILGISPEVTHLTVLVLIMLAFTLIDAAFTAALGVAIPLSNWPRAVVGVVTVAIRAVTIGLALWFADMIRLALINDGPYIMIASFGLFGFVFGTWLALRIAEMIAVRGHVSPV